MWKNILLDMCTQPRFRAQSDQSTHFQYEETASLVIQNVPSDDSDQTAQMRRLF